MAIEFNLTLDDVEILNCCPGCKNLERLTVVTELQLVDGPTFLSTDVCEECGLIFRRLRPTPAWFDCMWRVRWAAQQNGAAMPLNSAIEKARYNRYARTAEVLRKHGGGPVVVDIGCGPATGLAALADAGLIVTGLEPDRARSRFVTVPNVKVVEATLEQFAQTASGGYDAALCQHALEHFHQPRSALASIASLVKVDGLVYIEVPDFRFDVKDWNDALYLAHQTNFEADALVRLAVQVGLDVVSREYPSADVANEFHLAYVFRKSAVNVVLDPTSRTDVPLNKIRSFYTRGLPIEPQAGTIRFEVPFINDLSMTLKGNPQQVLATVRENFSGRMIEFDYERNVYRVCAANMPSSSEITAVDL